MPLTPAVGRPGGQRYDVARAIRTFLEQMAGGGGFSFGGAVIKEPYRTPTTPGLPSWLWL